MFLFTALLLCTAQAASPWYALPTTGELHTVGANQGREYYTRFVEQVAGEHASSLFRDPLADLQVYYALWEANQQAPWLEEADLEALHTTFNTGASLALEAWLMDFIGRSDGLDSAVRVTRTVFSPNLKLEQHKEGWQTELNSGSLSPQARVRLREENAGLGREEANTNIFQVGAGLRTWSSEQLGEEDQIKLDATLYARLQRGRSANVYLAYRLVARNWELTARKKVTNQLAASLLLQSGEDNPYPGRWGAGLNLNIPRAESWSAYFRFRQDIPVLPTDQPGSTVEATLRFLPRNPAIVTAQRWPLGQRLGAPGPFYPQLWRGTPNGVATRVYTLDSAAADPLLDLP